MKRVSTDSSHEDDFKANQNKVLAEEGILKIAYYMSKNKIDLRYILQDILFDQSIDGKEFELIPIREFGEVARTIMGLEDKHI